MSFDPVEDTKKLIDFIKGNNKNDDELIKLVTSRTNKERLKIKDEYTLFYNNIIALFRKIISQNKFVKNKKYIS